MDSPGRLQKNFAQARFYFLLFLKASADFVVGEYVSTCPILGGPEGRELDVKWEVFKLSSCYLPDTKALKLHLFPLSGLSGQELLLEGC